ncbi:hypothetical protein [Serratia symbiotica]|uniref:hypothetical protein n=1 Tax=Serratia symbiotica TaxID=138074 RepID=UPI0030D4353C
MDIVARIPLVYFTFLLVFALGYQAGSPYSPIPGAAMHEGLAVTVHLAHSSLLAYKILR